MRGRDTKRREPKTSARRSSSCGISCVMEPALASMLRTELHCNALLHVPASGALLCGMYEHVAKENKRLGALHACAVDGVTAADSWRAAALPTSEAAHVEGVFDLRLLAPQANFVAAGRCKSC